MTEAAFWNFVADQQADPVVRRLHEQASGTGGESRQVAPFGLLEVRPF